MANLIILFAFVILGGVAVCEKCVKNEYSTVYRGYQSSYNEVRGREDYPEIRGCVPIQIWSMVRHGTRNPHEGSAARMNKYLTRMKKDILTAHYSGKGHMCANVIKSLEKWTFDRSLLREAKFLVQSGFDELSLMGRRQRGHFPDLLSGPFDKEKHYFAYSNNQRNIISCDAFGGGLFGDDFNASRDGRLDYLAEVGCRENVAKRTEKYPLSQPEVKAFYESAQIYNRVAKHFAFMTGTDVTLSESQVDTLFEACHYETAKYGAVSPWCSLLNPDDLYLIVYSEMLMHYYEFAYGKSKLSNNYGCRQIKGLVNTFNKTANSGVASPVLKAYVSHDLVMEMFFTGLGCFKDSQLLTTDYNDLTENKYNSSLNCPFAANFVAVLYRCTEENTYKLQFYMNERPIGCCMSEKTEPCPWDAFESKFRAFTDRCIDDPCETDDAKFQNDSGSNSTGHSATLIITLISFFLTMRE